MKTTVQKSYQFSAAHWIPTLPEGHKCRSMHGHTYSVTVEVDGYDENTGMVADFGVIDAVVQVVLAGLDHRTLNNILQLDVPTVEVISRYLLSVFKSSSTLRFVAVTVQEGNGGSARTTE
jgi:6-pyruvoyltetrahydropterin/6-carboxytetrahydropterin synthase